MPEGVKPGSRVYLIVSDPLTKKDAALQRFVPSSLENLLRNIFLEYFQNVCATSALQAISICFKSESYNVLLYTPLQRAKWRKIYKKHFVFHATSYILN